MAREFPGFRTIERLHASSRSTVDRAIRLGDGATVVVKQAADAAVTPQALRRTQHEYDVLSALRGEGVVVVYELVRDGSDAALIIEDLGPVLARSIAQRRLSFAGVLDVAIELARSIARVHAAGIVHKDINPNNVVYDPESRVATLIDFDLASHSRGASPSLAGTGMLEGTLPYLAPEQTGRLNRTIDARSDLYAFGVTLYELLTGRLPFEGDDALALVHAHLAQQPSRVDDVDPAIPDVVGDIVMKLLAKAPEQRYQTATGVQVDLERCRSEFETKGRIERFVVGEHDVTARLEFADRLYGRQPEIRALLDAFDRAVGGATETVLVSGYSGIGKSSVVREIYGPVTVHDGHVASGAFEQLNRDVPYSAVVVALEQLIDQILAETTIDRWRAEIAAAIGDDGPLVRSVLPAIERVLGPPAPAPALEPEAARHRLALAMSRLIQVFAARPHPLVLFLDDMQWVDAASLQLLTQLAICDATQSLLVIEAYRVNEVDATHPFAIAMHEHEQRGATVSRIALAPLSLSETTEMVADALRLAPERIGDAAAVIWRKTEGNPFFIRRFMHVLYDEGCIAFDPRSNAFSLDASAIDCAVITDNVADLLAHQLGKLPDATCDALAVGAAIGAQFDVATLALVVGCPPDELHRSLAPAVQAGMIVPAAGETRVVSGGDDGLVVGGARYRFQHDRIQQAAYEAARADERDRLHLAIGRRLLAVAGPGEVEQRLFEIVHHLQLGLALIEDEPERARFVELVLEAARRARRSGAYDVAARSLRAAAATRDPRAHHATWFAAHLELAEVLSLDGQHAAARDIVRAVSKLATPREQATLAALDTTICVRLGRTSEALVCGRRAASLLGLELPSDPAELSRQVAAEIAGILATVAERPIESWIDLPAMTDPDKLTTMALLVDCIPATYQAEPALFALLCTKLVGLALRHGNCGASAHGYSSLAIVLWAMRHYDTAFRFGKLGVELADRLGAQAVAPAVNWRFAVFASPWRRPLAESIERTRATITTAIDAGDVAHAGYAALFTISYRMIKGESLDDVIDEARQLCKLCSRLALPRLEATIRWYVWHARTWTGAPPGPGERDVDVAATDGTAFNSSSFLPVSGTERYLRTQALTEANRQLRHESEVRARMETELRLSQKLQSVGQLAAGVAHEINTPMQYVGDNLAFLDEAVDSLLGVIDAYRAAFDPTARVDLVAVERADDEFDLAYLRTNAREACRGARDGVQRVSRIVLAMKAFSHPERRDQVATALGAALQNTLVVAQNQYRLVADIVTDFADLPDVTCYPSELNQVFLNLIVNAAHAIEDVVKTTGGRGTITIRTRRDTDDTVVITIADTGAGIPESIRDRVFDPFFTTKEVGRGTGQGLALSRITIVNRHGGTIGFDSRVGEGTTFSIRLPISGHAAATSVAGAR